MTGKQVYVNDELVRKKISKIDGSNPGVRLLLVCLISKIKLKYIHSTTFEGLSLKFS